MLSSVLNSGKAIEVNIQIMRVFVKFRELISVNKEIAQKLSQIERKYEHHDFQIQKLFDLIKRYPFIEEKPPQIKGFIKE